MKKKNHTSPFFITGLGRSGTTLLRLMLTSHPNIAIPYESHFIDDYQKNIQKYGELNDHRNLNKLVSAILSEETLNMWDCEYSVETIISSINERSLKGVLDAIYTQYAESKGKTRWGDKSDYLDGIPEINTVFPDSRFVHIIRDGRDVIKSVNKLNWGPNDLIAGANWWAEYVRLGRRLGALLGPDRYIEVRYEDLVTNPVEELTKICHFLEEEFSDKMLHYYQESKELIPQKRRGQHYNTDKPLQNSRAFSWKTEMSKVDVQIFDRYAGKILRDCGYEKPIKSVPKPLEAIRILQIMATRLIKSPYS
jgi:hypothetical protein